MDKLDKLNDIDDDYYYGRGIEDFGESDEDDENDYADGDFDFSNRNFKYYY